VAIDASLRFAVVELRIAGSNDCATVSGENITRAECGTGNQEFRLQVLSSDFLSLVSNTEGRCIEVSGNRLVLGECTNAPEQQFSFVGSAADGYVLSSFTARRMVADNLELGDDGASIQVIVGGDADPLAVVVDERAVGWATMAANVVIPDDAPPNGDEGTRAMTGTTGGGSWESARASGFANVSWFTPADFVGANRDNSFLALSAALAGTEARIIIFEAGDYDMSLTTPKAADSCQASCGNGGSYTQVGGFCNCSTTTCQIGGYQDYTRTLDVGSNKTLIGLGAGANFTHLMMRVVRNHNIILRNLSYRELPGDVRAWDDALLFYPGDHVWLDHLSFSGFGRGAVVLSGTRVDDGAGSFTTYRDAGWMTFSWLVIDSSEDWRCSGSEDSPYPFFTTANPGLTFDHVLFRRGHGRNPAIDYESAHFINSAWEDVTDGLDGRHGAELLVEGCTFDGERPIRMDDEVPPTVLAPWDASQLDDRRRQVIFSSTAWASIIDDFGARGIDMDTLNTNSVSLPTYPYGLDPNPSDTLQTVKAGGGVGKGGFPACAGGQESYTCE